MGDYTGFGITVYRITRKRKKFTAAIEEVVGDYTCGPADRFALEMGETIESGEVRCGTVDELAHELIKLDPDAIWEMNEDPKYEWLGSVAKYHPDTGLFMGECASGGEVVVEYRQLVDTGIFLSPESDEYTMQGHLDAQHKLNVLLGRYQDEAIREFVQRPAEEVPDAVRPGTTDDLPTRES